jgi:hypothetical protein
MGQVSYNSLNTMGKHPRLKKKEMIIKTTSYFGRIASQDFGPLHQPFLH